MSTSGSTVAPDDWDGDERTALEFFDPVLAATPFGVPLVRALVGASSPAAPIVIPADLTATVGESIMNHRLEPQLAASVRAGRVEMELAQHTMLEQHTRILGIRALQRDLLAVEFKQVLDGADVSFLVLKGLATGRLDHRPDVLRQTCDVDVLVREADFGHAAEALLRAGYVEPDDTRSLMEKGGSWTAPDGQSVDVHTRPHTAGRTPGDHWWLTAEEFDITGTTFRALGRGGRLAHAASHLALSYPNHRHFSSLLDLLVIARRATDHDRSEAQRFLTEIGVSDLVWRITRRAAPLVDDSRIILGRPGNRPLDRALRLGYDRPDLDKTALKLCKTFGMPWSGRRRVLQNWVHPSPEYLALGGYTSMWDRVSKVTQRQFDRLR